MLNKAWSVRRAAAVLAIAVFGFGLPVGAAIADAGGAVILAVATLLGLVAVSLGGGWHELLRQHRAKWRRPAAVAALVFAAVAVSSLTWSVDRVATFRALAETLVMIYAGLVAACALPLIAGRSSGWMLVAGLTVGTLLIIAEGVLGTGWHGWPAAQAFAFEPKRGLIVLVLLVWPAAGFLAGRGRTAWAAGLVALLFAAAQLMSAGAASLGLVMGAIGFGGARLAPRRMLAAAMAFVALAIVTAPFAASLAAHLLPGQALRLFVTDPAEERIRLWHAYEERFLERPTLGYGFGASARVANGIQLAGTAADTAIAGEQLHNSYLQILIEEGIVGAVAAAPLFIAIFFALARMPPARLPLPLALFLASTSMALVGFGSWQPWWIAVVASAIIWLAINDRSADIVETTRG